MRGSVILLYRVEVEVSPSSETLASCLVFAKPSSASRRVEGLVLLLILQHQQHQYTRLKRRMRMRQIRRKENRVSKTTPIIVKFSLKLIGL